MKHESNPHDSLIDDVLTDPETELLRDRSLDQMLSQVHRHQQRRGRLLVTGLVLAPTLAGLCLLILLRSLIWPDPMETASHPETVAPTMMASVAQTELSSGVKILSDSELLGMFKDCPVALVGPAGQRKFILLGDPNK